MMCLIRIGLLKPNLIDKLTKVVNSYKSVLNDNNKPIKLPKKSSTVLGHVYEHMKYCIML